MSEVYPVGVQIVALTPGGTYVRGPGPIGEPTIEHLIPTTYDVATMNGFGVSSLSGLMLLGPNDFDGPDLRLSAKFQLPALPEPLEMVSFAGYVTVHAYLLIPATVWQEEAE